MTVTESKPLASLRVLVPRPAKAADAFCQRLAACGARLSTLPVIEIQPLLTTPAAQGQAASALAAADVVIFVSVNSVDLALAALRGSARDFAPGAVFYGVGRTTAARLAQTGREVRCPPTEATSEGLLALPELARVAGKSVLICRGRGGRDVLRDGLSARGARVSYLDLYLRQPSARHRVEINTLLMAGQLDVAAIHSGDILTALLACLTPPARQRLLDLPLLVPGERVAAVARERGCHRLVVAASALPENMVTALVHWYTQRESGRVSP